MADFNITDPPVAVTDPAAATTPRSAEYPRHLYRAHAAPTADAPLSDAGLIVAWQKTKPIYNEILAVDGDLAKASALKDGWSLDPVLTGAAASDRSAATAPDPAFAPKAKKAKKAKKGATVLSAAAEPEPAATPETPAPKAVKAAKSKKGK